MLRRHDEPELQVLRLVILLLAGLSAGCQAGSAPRATEPTGSGTTEVPDWLYDQCGDLARKTLDDLAPEHDMIVVACNDDPPNIISYDGMGRAYQGGAWGVANGSLCVRLQQGPALWDACEPVVVPSDAG